MIHARFRCEYIHERRRCEKEPQEWSGNIEEYQLALVAIWFHSSHEGHNFSYWEDGKLIIGPGDLSPSERHTLRQEAAGGHAAARAAASVPAGA